ncbi:MAG TPA: VPLPA-CTERM sorting domain-containing protein [Steroidobacteraceae bacterium]|nr:VPLPA-CTERM sorting domain-containing protein [Steroidobacteraceae bacterium]
MTALAAAAAIGAGLAATQAHASTVELTLGAEHTGAYIEDYFLGGADSVPSDGDGPNLGFGFSDNATVQKAGDSASTGDGKFEGNPSGQSEILAFSADNSSGALNTGGSYMNFATGFSTVSFNYALSANSSQFNGTADIWSGLNGTGTLLGTIALSATAAGNSCTVRTDAYCNWSVASASGFGVAESVTFGATSTSDYAEFDGLQVTPVPLPAAVWLFLSGALGLGRFARKARAV